MKRPSPHEGAPGAAQAQPEGATGAAPLHHRVGQASSRVEALADGVFAIAMTILVFDLQLPDESVPLAAALRGLVPKLLVFAISFALLGIYWAGHRGQFHYIRKTDHDLHWLNILLLAFVSLLPFSAKVLSRQPLELLAQAVYGGNLIVIGLTLYWNWHHAHSRGLVEEEVPEVTVRGAVLRCLVAPACYLLAIGVAFLDSRVSLAFFVLVPILYIVPQLQALWWRAAARRRPGG